MRHSSRLDETSQYGHAFITRRVTLARQGFNTHGRASYPYDSEVLLGRVRRSAGIGWGQARRRSASSKARCDSLAAHGEGVPATRRGRSPISSALRGAADQLPALHEPSRIRSMLRPDYAGGVSPPDRLDRPRPAAGSRAMRRLPRCAAELARRATSSSCSSTGSATLSASRGPVGALLSRRRASTLGVSFHPPIPHHRPYGGRRRARAHRLVTLFCAAGCVGAPFPSAARREAALGCPLQAVYRAGSLFDGLCRRGIVFPTA